MKYLKIELTTGTPLDVFYQPERKDNEKLDWTKFGTSIQTIKLDDLVLTGQQEADGDYIYLLPIADETQANACKIHLLTYTPVKTVEILDRTQAEALHVAIKTYKDSLEV